MNAFWQGFFDYEKALLFLGIALFLVLLLGLFLSIIQKKEIKRYYLFAFLIPVVMIAYPSVQKISFMNDVFVLEKALEKIEEEPKDSTAKENLEQALEETQARLNLSVHGLNTAAKAQLRLNQLDQAEKTIQKALKQAPKDPEVQETLQELEACKRRTVNVGPRS